MSERALASLTVLADLPSEYSAFLVPLQRHRCRVPLRQERRLTMAKFKAIHTNRDTGSQTLLGEVEVGADGRLRLLRAEPAHQKFMDDFVSEMNGKKELGVKGSPPPGVRGEEDALYRDVYKRSDPNFLKGIMDYTHTYFRFDLVPYEGA
jgi:hypothetical protein